MGSVADLPLAFVSGRRAIQKSLAHLARRYFCRAGGGVEWSPLVGIDERLRGYYDGANRDKGGGKKRLRRSGRSRDPCPGSGRGA